MIKNNIKIIFLLFSKFFFSISKRNKNISKIFFLLSISFLIIFLINGFSFGLLSFVDRSINSGYGDIYVEFKYKMNYKEIKKKKIKEILTNQNDIKSFFLYGVNNGILKSYNEYIPIYIISYIELNNLFFNVVYQEHKKIGFLTGSVLYKKYQSIDHKKIFLIKKENAKKKIMYFDSMPIHFNGYLELLWDEWNEKAIFIPINKFENYFEIKSINALNIYVHDKKKSNLIINFLKNTFKNDIRYISIGHDVLPQYNNFLHIISIIDSFIMYIIFGFSLFLLFILIGLYMADNEFDIFFLLLLGIKKNNIILSILLLFICIFISSLIFGTLIAALIIFSINYFKLICINLISNSYFICSLNYQKIIIYIGIYMLFLILILIRYTFKIK